MLKLPGSNLSYLFLLFFLTPSVGVSENQPVMGAGPSTVIAKKFFEHFSKSDVIAGYSFEVEARSIKHAGGIRVSGKYLFGRTGRPLNDDEREQNKQDIFLARIPIAIVAGKKNGAAEISLEQLKAVFTGRITNWKELGGNDHAIVLVGREASEAAFGVLKEEYEFFRNVKFDKVFGRDHQLVNFITSQMGDFAISFGAMPNFDDENILAVTGFQAGINLGLVYDRKNADHPVVKGAVRYARSSEWQKVSGDAGLMPPRY